MSLCEFSLFFVEHLFTGMYTFQDSSCSYHRPICVDPFCNYSEGIEVQWKYDARIKYGKRGCIKRLTYKVLQLGFSFDLEKYSKL